MAAAAARRTAGRVQAAAVTRRWAPYSRLLAFGDTADWVLRQEVAALEWTADRLGVATAPGDWHRHVSRQSVFYADQFSLTRPGWDGRGNRVGVSYFHGRPGTPGAPEFDEVYRVIRDEHLRMDRIRVSHAAMRDLVLETGVPAAKVHLLPIAVDLALFTGRGTGERERYAVPREAFVVGSFQKDGVGWGEGREPKLVKGPDVLLRVLELLRGRIPELFVLLSGPARGYVREGLERLGIPYRHLFLRRYEEMPELYRLLDAYVVTSREEGGPKAVLESMAMGVPVVTTRVGQAADLVMDGENGWSAAVDDAEALADALAAIASGTAEVDRVIAAGRETAAANSVEAQVGAWRALFAGFVALPS